MAMAKPERKMIGMAKPGVVGQVNRWRPGMGSFKRGGKVKRTGVYKVHKGERITHAKRSARGRGR